MERFSPPNCLTDLKISDGLVRNTWPYYASIDKQHLSRPLNFRDEALSYQERVLVSRDADHVEIIQSLADAITLKNDTRFICCILCHANEKTESYRLEGIVECIAKAGGHTVFFVNAARPDYTEDDCKVASIKLLNCFPVHAGYSDKVSVVSHLFSVKTAIGAIRGIITDSIVIASAHRGLVDPILVSTDIDFMAVPDDYGMMLMDSFAAPELDIMSGPVFYGYDHQGNDHTDGDHAGVSLCSPELFLGNRAFYYKKMAVANGLVLDEPYYPTDGPNTAFRLSAYCAAGGHNYAFVSGEDNYIGAAIFALRSENNDMLPQPGHAIYNPEFWIATDPRRQLLSISAGYPIDATWREIPFYQKLGSTMDTANLIGVYADNEDLIQCANISDLSKDSISGKVQRRLNFIFDASTANGALPHAAVKYISENFGLEFSSDKQAGEGDFTGISSELMKCLTRCCC